MPNITIIGRQQFIGEVQRTIQDPSYVIFTIPAVSFKPEDLTVQMPDLVLYDNRSTMDESNPRTITNETISRDKSLQELILEALKQQKIPFAVLGQNFDTERILEAARLGAHTYIAVHRPLTTERADYVRAMVRCVLGEGATPRYPG